MRVIYSNFYKQVFKKNNNLILVKLKTSMLHLESKIYM